MVVPCHHQGQKELASFSSSAVSKQRLVAAVRLDVTTQYFIRNHTHFATLSMVRSLTKDVYQRRLYGAVCLLVARLLSVLRLVRSHACSTDTSECQQSVTTPSAACAAAPKLGSNRGDVYGNSQRELLRGTDKAKVIAFALIAANFVFVAGRSCPY